MGSPKNTQFDETLHVIVALTQATASNKKIGPKMLTQQNSFTQSRRTKLAEYELLNAGDTKQIRPTDAIAPIFLDSTD